MTLFKFLKTSWDSLNLADLQLPTIPSYYQKKVPALLAFINYRLEPENAHLLPRCDYKELLELAKLFLGGCINRKKGYIFQLQRPGADHHARWMSKAIYTLKLSFAQHQIACFPWQKKYKVKKMALFIVFTYLESWYTSPSLLGAPSNDLQL